MTRKPISLQNKTCLSFWIAYHALIFTAFAGLCVANRGKINIDADLFNMLPKPVMGKALNAADERLTEMTGQNVFILASNSDFGAAKAAAEAAYSALSGSSGFKSLSLYQDAGSIGGILDFIHMYRWNLLDESAAAELEAPGGPEQFAQNALGTAYGAFTMMPLNLLESDPFLLTEYDLQNYLAALRASGTQMSLKDGVLASFHNEKWYVMIRGVLSKEGAALASDKNAVVEIHAVCGALEADGTKFIYSGTPFHSYKSSSNASREIATISSISMFVVLVILLLIFKRPHPILFSIASIFISTFTAICATLLVFGKMHVLTMVFGTSLIGSCIDYSLHYFIHWKGNKDFHTGSEVRNHLLMGLALSLVSTVLCYFILVFAPFNLLRQMAVFSISGIVSSFLTVVCIYPYVPVPETGRDIALMKIVRMPEWYNKKLVGRIVITLLFAATIGTLAVFRKNVRIENNLAKLYKLEGRELADEAEASGVLQYNPSGWFIVSGGTAEETLQREERLTAELRRVNAGKEKGGFICTSLFIPSVAAQQKSRDAAARLLPLAPEQYEALGYAPETAASLRRDFAESDGKWILLDGGLPEFLKASVSSAWLGEIDGSYYSVVLPVSVTDAAAYRSIAAESEGVYFVSKVKDMNRDLDALSRMILMLFAVVYVVIFIVLRFFYTWKQSFKIISVPMLIVLVTSAIFAVAKINLEFFSITGMILVFGLGLDYVIYMIENEKRQDAGERARLEPFAILLSFVTTAVSFGALALSKFVPVHMLGLSIFIGLTTAFVSTFFYTRADF
ncbi:MAG: MMPL family transporter [Treponemataceae bacterium]|nr:MMPL family transporter [Treponemataceae bacterium]